MFLLLTGGSGCGKSSFAEDICAQLQQPRYYIAAMKPYGEGGLEKIEKHRKQRAGKGFETIERYENLAGLKLDERGTVLLECICNLTANEMYDERGNATDPVEKIVEGVKAISAQCNNIIVITNDVASDGITYDESTEWYIRAVSQINHRLSVMADCVCEMVCGIPIELKGSLKECCEQGRIQE